MKKKIVSIILSVTMLLGAFSLSACTNSELEAKLEDLQTKIEQLQDQNEELQLSLTQQQSQIAGLEQENEDLQQQVSGLEQENEDLQASVSEQQTKIETLEQANEDLQVTLTQQQEQITVLENDKKNLEEDMNELLDVLFDDPQIVIATWKHEWESDEPDKSLWYYNVEVTVDFPRVVKKGEDLIIKISTKNVLETDLVYYTCYCCYNKGVTISDILLQGSGDMDSFTKVSLLDFYSHVHDAGLRENVLKAGESFEYEKIIKTKDATIGVYDIYMYNHILYKNAIRIIE